MDFFITITIMILAMALTTDDKPTKKRKENS
jgi:hypothetical protein